MSGPIYWDESQIREARTDPRYNPATAYRIAPDTWLRLCTECEREETSYGVNPAHLWNSDYGRHLADVHGLQVGGYNVGLLP